MTENDKTPEVPAIEAIDRHQEHERFLADVLDGLADSEAGRLIDDEALDIESLLGA